MLGASGCGKTTTLRMIAGLEQPTSGTITVDGRDFMAVPPQQRNIGMVFQSYALFPHLTIFENVAYGLRLRGLPAAEIERRVAATLALLQLEPLCAAASGRRCRAASSSACRSRARWSTSRRCCCSTSRSPTSTPSCACRCARRSRALQRRLGITTLYVTHDQEEATAVSDRIAVFDHGRLIQLGTPEEIYTRPPTLFVADFIGRANFLPARLAVPASPAAGVMLAQRHDACAAAARGARRRRGGARWPAPTTAS